MTSDEDAALEEELAELREVIADLATEVERQATLLNGLHTAQARGEHQGKPAAPPRPWCWLGMTHLMQAERLIELGTWISQVLFAWPSAQRAVLPCWPRHWDVIEELSMLYVTWTTAYLWDGSSGSDAGEYLDRWLPGAIARIEIRLRPCGQRHQPDGPRRDDSDVLTEVVEELRWQ